MEEKELAQIPLIVFEQNEMRNEKRFKRLWAIIIIQALLFTSVAGFGVYYLFNSEITTTEVTTHVVQDSDAGSNFNSSNVK